MRLVPMLLFGVFALAGAATPGAAAPDTDSKHPVAQVDASDHFTPAEIERSRDYSGPRRLRAVISLVLALVLVSLLAFGPIAAWFAGRAASLTGGRAWLAGALLAIAYVIIGALVALPIRLIALDHDRAFGLSKQGIGDVLVDRVKGIGFEGIIFAVAGAGLIALARALPRSWPVVTSVGAAILTVVLVLVFPLLYEPAFNRFTPAPDDVADRVTAIAAASGVEIGDVLVIDASRRTTRHNAYVSGIGPTRRVVLYDTLLAESPESELDLIVAHELAHVRHNDVAKGTWLGMLGAVLGIWALWAVLRLLGISATSPRAVMVAAFVFYVGSLLTSPIVSAVSRRVETRADATAIDVVAAMRSDLAGTVSSAVDLEVSLARANVADLDPPAWMVWAFASHPPVLERIGAALERGSSG